jgi:arylsulfatase A-like enzyme
LDVPEEYFRRYQGKVPDKVAKFYGMIENIDENVGRLLAQLDEWDLTRDTLVVFLTDNGGTAGATIYNAAMRGSKNTPYQGGTRVPSFWRWPAGFKGGVDCNALSAHIDILPTLAEICGIKLTGALKKQVEGRSLLPLLKNPKSEWSNRVLVTHIGRWDRGDAANSKYAGCSIRDQRFTLVNNRELYDLREDPGETHNVMDANPDALKRLRTAYDEWWQSVLPRLENENAVGPEENPFKQLYRKQFGSTKNSGE